MARRFVGLAAVAVAVVTLSSCAASAPSHSEPTATAAALGVGTTLFPVADRVAAPELHGTTLDGKAVSLPNEVDHQVVVLNVWASWCEPCRGETPALAMLATSLRAADVRFVGLDEQDTTAAARAFVATTHSPYPHLVDKNGSLLRTLRVLPQSGIPSTLVLDRHGRVAARVIGPTTAPALQRIIGELLNEQ